MNNNKDLKVKLAWQTAYELRTCPDATTLYAFEPDDNLARHLEICHVCRDKRDMPLAERQAWQTVSDRFAELAVKPDCGTVRQARQVWTLTRECGGWREGDRFCRPPVVLLLEKIAGTSGWKVAQLYSDKALMGPGDVALADRYGFAEGWNCYTLKEDRLDRCLGKVTETEFAHVVAASFAAPEPIEEGSILAFFREMEIETGTFVAVPSVLELVEEWEGVPQPEAQESYLQQLFGAFDKVRTILVETCHGWRLPETATSLYELLSRARQLEGAPMLAADYTAVIQANLVSRHVDGLLVGTLIATIINDYYFDNGMYFVAGNLSKALEANTLLLASITLDSSVICQSRYELTAGATYFALEFSDICPEVCSLDNVTILLVSL